MTMSFTTFKLHQPSGLASWTATAFDCECCGRRAVAVVPTCEAVEGPTFEIARDGRKILLTSTWLDGEDYVSEHWSVPGALSAMCNAISMAAEATEKLDT